MCLRDKVIHHTRLTEVWTPVKFVQTEILPEQDQHSISMNELGKMIYCTAAQQQLCVGNKAVAPKLFMRYNKTIVAIQSVCRWG